MNTDKYVSEILNQVNVAFENGELEVAVQTYRQLQFLYPKEKAYYITYIHYLEEEDVIAELLWSAYEESLACCERAIQNLPEKDVFYFYQKKLELLILMSDQDYSWYISHQEKILDYASNLLRRYSGNVEMLKRLMALYRVTGNLQEEQELQDKAYHLDPNDFNLLIYKVVDFEKKEEYQLAVELLENYLKINNLVNHHKGIVYKKLIGLFKQLNNPVKAAYYEQLSDNL